jgi:hypothetical protein
MIDRISFSRLAGCVTVLRRLHSEQFRTQLHPEQVVDAQNIGITCLALER